MADEPKDQQQEEQSAARDFGPIIRMGMGAAAFLAAILAGLLVFRLVLAPMLAEPTVAELDEDYEPIPLNPIPVRFDTSFVNVVREGDFPASTLMFGLTLECNNQIAADLVEMHRARFADMLIKLHDSRTRAELDDTLTLKNSIQRQALQKCNDLLVRLQDNPDPEAKITAVFHHTFTVQDQL